MNQNVLFNDDIHWDETAQQVSFTAQSSGALVRCYLSASYLSRIGIHSTTNQELVTQCQLMQFDIEEDAQQAIDDEHLNERNELWL
jgi:hypothetical protein